MKRNENINSDKMVDFNLSDFDVNTTDKYESCCVEEKPLSAENLTKIFNNGWKLINYTGYSKTRSYGGEKTTVEVFTYMFENTNYGKVERV